MKNLWLPAILFFINSNGEVMKVQKDLLMIPESIEEFSKLKLFFFCEIILQIIITR